MKYSSFIVAVACIALWSGSSIAEPRSGPTLHLLGGPGYSTGSYVFQGNSLPGYGVPVRLLTFETTLAAPTLSASIQPGWFVTPNFKLALEMGVQALAGGSSDSLAGTKISAVFGWQALALVDYYVSEGPGFHVQGGGGFARANPMGSTQDMGSYDNIVRPSWAGGAIGVVGIGYDFNSWFGLLARGATARLSNDDSHYYPVTVSLLADFALF